MELKELSTPSTYKLLSRDNNARRKVYLAELPWKEMAIDVDSLVFFHMRNYLDKPYRSRKDEIMVCASFLHDIERSTNWLLADMVRYSIRQLTTLIEFLSSIGMTLHPIYSIGIPEPKEDLYKERATKRKALEDGIRELGNNILVPGIRANVMTMMRKYILHFRDDVRDKVVRNIPIDISLHLAFEADKVCGREHLVTMSEDVDIFLFGDASTIIVKPFLVTNIKPTYVNFVDCESYYVAKGIKSHSHFVQVALLMGTDYNNGVKGMGVKRSVAAIAKYRSAKRYVTDKYDLGDDNATTFVERCDTFIKYLDEEDGGRITMTY